MKMRSSISNGNTILNKKESDNKKPSKVISNNIVMGYTSDASKNTNFNNINKVKKRDSNAESLNNAILFSTRNDKDKSNITNITNNVVNNKIINSKQIPSSNVLKENRIRKDFKGNPILKGGKKHRISFKDLIGKNNNLVETIEIESYKAFNAFNETIIEDDDKKDIKDQNDNTSCSCVIF